MNYALATFNELLKYVLQLLDFIYVNVFSGTITNDHYKAEFVSADQILSKKHWGIVVDGKRALKRSAGHALIISPTGGGKSTTVIVPTILNAKGSFLINDP